MKNAALNIRGTILKPAVAFLLLVAINNYCLAQNKDQNKPSALSLDYCADQYLLALADKDQIMALTKDAVKEHSFYRDRTKGIPLFGATSEEVLNKKPDIILRYWGGFRMLPLLERANIPVIFALFGTDEKVIYQNLRLMGSSLHQENRANNMIRDYQKRMIEVKKTTAEILASHRPIRAAYITPGGVTAGADTFVNDIIKLTGLTSLPEELGLIGWAPLPLEAMIQNPPDLLIGSFFDLSSHRISPWSLSRHGNIKQMLDNIPTIMVPSRYLSCNGIFTIDAAEYIQAEIKKLFPNQGRIQHVGVTIK